MAIYYFDVSNVSRNSDKKSSSSVAASAYQNREKFTDERTGLVHDYTKRGGLYHSEIMAPPEANPTLISSPSVLWNTIEAVENRKDARLAKDIKISLPIELSPKQNKELLQDFAKRAFVDRGMIVDIAIHDIDTQPHSHIKTTTRELTPDGFGKKVREWDKPDTIKEWRELWADVANEHLKKAGLDVTIDHRTIKDQMKEAIKQYDEAKTLEEKIEFAAKAIELDRPAMKRINTKNWHNPEFQKIRRDEQEAKSKIIKKAKSFKSHKHTDVQEMHRELEKRFKPKELLKLIKKSISKTYSKSINKIKEFNFEEWNEKRKENKERKKYPNLYAAQDYEESDEFKIDQQKHNDIADEKRRKEIETQDKRNRDYDQDKLKAALNKDKKPDVKNDENNENNKTRKLKFK